MAFGLRPARAGAGRIYRVTVVATVHGLAVRTSRSHSEERPTRTCESGPNGDTGFATSPPRYRWSRPSRRWSPTLHAGTAAHLSKRDSAWRITRPRGIPSGMLVLASARWSRPAGG